MTNKAVEEVNKSMSERTRAETINAQSKFYETLIKEIHHRVKNNLQMVSSLLFLQSRSIKDEDAKNAILASQQRVESLALIHKNLYQRENLAELEMKSYITQLCNALVETLKKEDQKISVSVEMDEIVLDIEKAIPIGLIINELVTNSLKYAFEGRQDGVISVSLHPRPMSKFLLTVGDNGQGLKSKKKGFGSQLIQILTQQIEGEMSEVQSEGYGIQLEF